MTSRITAGNNFSAKYIVQINKGCDEMNTIEVQVRALK